MIDLLDYIKFLLKRRFSPGETLLDMPLNVMDDKVFKKMLTSNTEDSRIALRHLLSACTRREVTDVKVLNNELLPVYMGGKSPRLDIRVNFNDGEAADIEMQIEKTNDDLKNRASYYSAMMQSAQAGRGHLYKNIKRVYQIFFLNHILFEESEKLPRRYGYREEKEHDLLTNTSQIIFYEMPKLDKLVNEYNPGKIELKNLPEDVKWCIFFRNHHKKSSEPLIKELCSKEEGIMRAAKQVAKLPRSYIRYMTVEMDRMKDNVDRMLAYSRGCEETDEKWQGVVAEHKAEIAGKDAEIADHKAEIADKDAEIARLQAELEAR